MSLNKIPQVGSPDENWNNDAIQFPRFIAEAEAAGAFTNEVIKEMRDSMDLNLQQLLEILERAQRTWDNIKAKI
jgi:hypothetical protein